MITCRVNDLTVNNSKQEEEEEVKRMGTNGVEAPPGGSSSTPASASPADSRLAELEASFLEGPLVPGTGGQARSFSTETLLDILVVLFDECQASSLRREKTVSEFIELGKKLQILHTNYQSHNLCIRTSEVLNSSMKLCD